MIKKVTLDDLEISFGTKKKNFSKKFLEIYKKSNLRYNEIEHTKENLLIQSLIKKILKDKKKIGSKERKIVWENGWNENFVKFKKNPKDLKTLQPLYIKKSPLRFLNKFILPKSKFFEYNYFQLLRQNLFDKYFCNYGNLYEFGSGTGLTSLALAQNFPYKKIFATDFVKSSIKIIQLIAKYYNKNINAQIFDIKKPNYKYVINKDSLVFTFGAIEQVSYDYKKFVNFLLKKKPGLIINMEPFKEEYNLKNYMDLLSYTFIEKRKYAADFLPYLKNLEKKKKIKIIKIKRTYFGGSMMESYNYIVWKVI
tara:strand:+ start:131 stop:1057 length:927 start_codon:yes stop_codon:yes gene_type:complete